MPDRRTIRWPAGLLLLALLAAAPARAVEFGTVVALGDSLFDVGTQTGRAPVASEHLAAKLGAEHASYAVSGATTATLLSGGQHTTAAANHGAGDIALVWIGGNDFIDNQLSITFGIYSFLNAMESDVQTAVQTLRAAGMEVVILSLPDLALTPGVILQAPPSILPNVTTASSLWNTRLANLAAAEGALFIDMFAFSQDVDANPQSYALYGVLPVPAPDFGDIQTCPFCLFFDEIHPSAMVQGRVANLAIDAVDAAFDPGGSMPVPRLTKLELFNLTQLVAVPLGPLAALGIAAALLAAGAVRLRGRAPR